MANPTITWTAKGESTASTLTLPRQLSLLQGYSATDGEVVVSRGGVACSVVHDAHEQYEMSLPAFGPELNPEFFADLTSWWASASQGVTWALALDGSKSANTTTTVASSASAVTLSVTSTASLATSDWLFVEDATDPTKRERRQVSSVSGANVILTRALSFGFAAGSTLRHAEYWPKCLALSRDPPFAERAAGQGSRLWDLRLLFRTVR